MDEDDQPAARAERRIVDPYAVAIGVTVANTVVDVDGFRSDSPRYGEEQCNEQRERYCDMASHESRIPQALCPAVNLRVSGRMVVRADFDHGSHG